MNQRVPSINVIAANDSYRKLVQPVLDHLAGQGSSEYAQLQAHLVLDFPLTWAIGVLSGMNSLDRARTMVVTQGSHEAYRDMLASFHVSGVAGPDDIRMLIAGVYAAASALKTYQWRSGLTYMELRVTRLIVQGFDTASSANKLKVSQKTINAHVSNILSKLGLESRTQYLASILGHGMYDSSGYP